ncbi:DCN1-like protein 2 [Monoraphidium neglectum]|uniref:Defective in cullin neddylation protein n=1 Tax=Monoraphidium neglectum TaxID=145388 RepID=A0A0D2LW68_9CHLO|nr:DCN1-like protein 2 [Monoraphidium neglectum]KIY93801.1 DCN1-like protein 2 [Monoraphidium neglectum]|eukprot:XP_013892821.1 DCN1-like protein 2 [Monoraphidium neglectum]
MNRSKKEKEKVQQFKTITGASDKIALDCLRATGWGIEAAIEYFYASGLQGAVPNVDMRAIEALFTRYKGEPAGQGRARVAAGGDPSDGVIMAEGVGRFCDDLEVDPSDIVMLVLSWRLNAATMCEYSREEFVGGLQQLGCDSLEKLKRRLPDIRADLRDPAKWREIYNYAFNWAKGKNQKCLQLDVAVGMWQLLFAEDRAWQHVDAWCGFLQKQHNRAISRDTWVQLFEFARAVKPDFSNFDESAAWPYL